VIKFKPDNKTNKTNKTSHILTETIMPSYEIIIKRDHQEFDKVWNECKRLLYRNARLYMENNRNH
jgi:hypothetical protein